MKRILLFLFCFVGVFVANAQYPATNLKQKFAQGVGLGSKDSTAFGANDSLVVSIDRNGKMIFRGNGVSAPFKVVSVTSDTAAMLLPYLRKSDTASMLAPYARASSLGIYLLKSDSLSGGYTTWLLTKKKIDSLGAIKVNYSDTAAMLSNYYNKTATNSLLAAKLNISDTASMLSPYARTSGLGSYLLKSDSLSGGYTTWLLTKKKVDSLGAVKLSVIDTAAMLANRLKISDTAYMLSGYARTGNIPSTANFVPYDGATRNVNLGTNRIYANDFSLRVPSTSADTIGRFRWNSDDLTANLGLTSSVVLQTGQEMIVLVKNQTGATIPNGTVVRQSGVVGSSGRLKVEPFLANGTHNSNQVLGLTTEDIPDGGDGFVTSYGKVNGVNTAAYPDSTILYASPTVAGGLTATPPTAPNNIVKIGTVVKSANPNGIILTRIVYGSNINQDEGVQLTNPLNSSLLVYDSLTTLWKNKTLVEIGALRVQDSTFTNGYTTRLRTKQIIDSLGAVKLNISDTAAMLAPFVQYSDTTGLFSNVVRTFGTQTVGGNKTFSSDLNINGITAGRGNNNLSSNTAFGSSALANAASFGSGANSAFGALALTAITIGTKNTAIGTQALSVSDNAEENTAVGYLALAENTTGSRNIALGNQAGYGVGAVGNTTGSNNIFIGYRTAGLTRTGTNETVIGYDLTGNGSNTVTIGNSSVTNNYFTGNIRSSNGTAFLKNMANGSSSDSVIVSNNGELRKIAQSSIGSGLYLPLSGGTLNNTTTGTTQLAINRSDFLKNARILFSSAGIEKWTVGMLSGGSSSFSISGSAGAAIRIDSAGNAITLGGALNGTSAAMNSYAATYNAGSGLGSLAVGRWLTQPESSTITRTYFTGSDASTYGRWEIYRATSTTPAIIHQYNADGSQQMYGALNGTSAAFSGAGSFQGLFGVGTTQVAGDIDNVPAQSFLSAPNSNFGHALLIRTDASGRGFKLVSSNFNNSTNTGTALSFGTSNIQAFANGNSSVAAMSLNASGGNVLIKTTTDNGTDALQVAGSVRATGQIRSDVQIYGQSAATGVSGYFTDATNSTLQIKHPSSGVLSFLNGANTTWLQESGGNVTLLGALNGTSAAFSGDILAGTSFTSSQKLKVGYGPSSGYLHLYGQSSNMYFGQDGTGAAIISDRDAPLYFQVGASERMRLTSAGRLLLNTTTDNGTDALQVAGSVTATVISGQDVFKIDASGQSFGGYRIKAGVTGTNEWAFRASNLSAGITDVTRSVDVLSIAASTGAATFSSSVTASGAIVTTGSNAGFTINRRDNSGYAGGWYSPSGSILLDMIGVGNAISFTGGTGAATFISSVTATGFIVSSDRRLKDIVSRSGDMITYKWKDKRDNRLHYGYVAQEVEKDNPDQVHTDDKGMKSVNYIEILVKKVNDLEREIKELKSKIK